jgi:RNA polymerase sigma-70 factor, ECF subfamily
LFDAAFSFWMEHRCPVPLEREVLLRILLAERTKVLAFIRSIVRQRELAEDIFQDVCVLAMEKHEQIQNAKHLLGWARTASRMLAMNALRKERKQSLPLDPSVLQLLEEKWQEHDEGASSKLGEALRNCMELLAPAARVFLKERYVEDKPMEEIARQRNRPLNSVYVTFSRIHSTLSDCVFQRLALKKSTGHG